MEREQGLSEIQRTRIIAILRGVKEADIEPLAEALLAGGITVLEITLNTPGAPDMIRRLQATHGDRLFIGAGTVLDMDDLQLALDAGASFIVTPNTDEDVIRRCRDQGVPIYPGAMTPSEIVRAWKAGATAVKLFPSASLGLEYIKELQGPLKHIPMVAVGGVNTDNIADFIRTGCHAVGIGSYVINLKEICEGNFDWVKERASQLTSRTIG
ncbi:bifunctional 4-hydroxy-2-oxoglutarate aldolase/2-dehydro-3-deoxy-phosphogluconate aldolase [Paenibacillus ginsengarvi]|uniref:Bifunctional 4-hydroxy-2-oxoglutarate aldolase/2-dehydro-3-deoxy-phosphogluconate aldolase n=1 Tax=Paenibacillus ginsengarvi TaxID=400777 RepID=A0A3B0CKQ5_9BACL|nr:bifunctional 4-hydroxy-2-oxoglutarate aldolase/2-dehydro-3-deoxy-phosphogluconate aldolase [Paenibacillus ginsengarvi]RKN85421.1 bifunctional 4-hydroxy-2-oxoglutarate aldolase/2-dehydro-3-deoxy-phosphogluconate aldolase [Paenibacillus ginsengarvi]